MYRKFSVFLLILVFYIPGYSVDFNKVDKYARSVHRTGDYKQLAKKLTAPFKLEEEKVRSIFVWITHNIKYDYRKFKKNLKGGGRTRISGRSKKEIELKKKKIKERKIYKVYSSGKGVCEDYSMLFQAMCSAVGIKSVYITGKTRTNPSKIGYFPNRSKHAWNAVKIDGKWFLVDATWAAGDVDSRSGKFHKQFEEGFFLTSPEIFILSHFPDDPKWQLLPKSMGKKEFSNNVFLHGGAYEFKIESVLPRNGYLNARKKFSLVKIKFKTTPPDIVMFKNGKVKKVSSIKNGNEITIKVPTLAKYHRNVVLGVKHGRKFTPVLEYKIK